MDTVILSDIHLGSSVSRVDDLTTFLNNSSFDKLIINGDLLDHLNFKKYRRKHWKLLSFLQKIQPHIIIGNHDVDKDGSDLIIKSLFKNVSMDMEIDTQMGRYLILHGHVCDPLLNYPLITETADHIYHLSHRVSKRLARWLKKRSKKVGGLLDYLMKQAVDLALEEECVGSILGHTHHAEDISISKVHYLNSGCWTGTEAPTYIEIREDKKPVLKSLE